MELAWWYNRKCAIYRLLNVGFNEKISIKGQVLAWSLSKTVFPYRFYIGKYVHLQFESLILTIKIAKRYENCSISRHHRCLYLTNQRSSTQKLGFSILHRNKQPKIYAMLLELIRVKNMDCWFQVCNCKYYCCIGYYEF